MWVGYSWPPINLARHGGRGSWRMSKSLGGVAVGGGGGEGRGRERVESGKGGERRKKRLGGGRGVRGGALGGWQNMVRHERLGAAPASEAGASCGSISSARKGLSNSHDGRHLEEATVGVGAG